MGISLSRLWPSPSPVRCIESACDSHGGTLLPKPDAICEGCWTSLLAVGLCDDWIQPIITNGVYCRYKGGRSCYMLRSHLKRSPLHCQCCILVQEAVRRADSASELEVRRPTSEVQRILRLTWANLVLAYTFRTLRDPSDKLTAFSAVAEAYSQVMHSDYLAGIWRRPGSKHNNTLLPELLWTVMAPAGHP